MKMRWEADARHWVCSSHWSATTETPIWGKWYLLIHDHVELKCTARIFAKGQCKEAVIQKKIQNEKGSSISLLAYVLNLCQWQIK